MSSHDIDRGAVWFSQISNELGASNQGIICLTRDNKDKPRILFEAGALAKGLTSSRVYTLLIDLKPEDVKDPLAQFNHTLPTKDDLYKLILSINRELDSRPIPDGIIRQVFEANWPLFEEKFENIINETEADTPPEIQRPQEDILSEILNSVRGIERRVSAVEATTNSSFVKSTHPHRLIRPGENAALEAGIIGGSTAEDAVKDATNWIFAQVFSEEMMDLLLKKYSWLTYNDASVILEKAKRIAGPVMMG